MLSVSLARNGTGFAPHASGPSFLRGRPPRPLQPQPPALTPTAPPRQLAFGAKLWAVWPPTATPWAPHADSYRDLLDRVHLDANASVCVQQRPASRSRLSLPKKGRRCAAEALLCC